eukprot:gene53980-72139_t
MDESYHTNSSPDVVDGWLGLMLADCHWHKLWDVNHINATAKHIADLPPDHGVLVVKQSPRGLPPLGPSPPSLSSLSSLNTTTYDQETASYGIIVIASTWRKEDYDYDPHAIISDYWYWY